jgi:hypothetical protein
MKDLLKALQKFQDVQAHPWHLVTVTFFSDGSGFLATSEAGQIADFANPEEAIAILKGEAQPEMA